MEPAGLGDAAAPVGDVQPRLVLVRLGRVGRAHEPVGGRGEEEVRRAGAGVELERGDVVRVRRRVLSQGCGGAAGVPGGRAGERNCKQRGTILEK